MSGPKLLDLFGRRRIRVQLDPTALDPLALAEADLSALTPDHFRS
jgi:hypothetical protein